MEENEWKKLKEEYKTNNNIMGVELSLARKLLTQYSNKFNIWQNINNIAPILIIIIAFITLGIIKGIIFSIVFIVLHVSIMGTASISLSKAINCLWIISIISIIINLLLDLSIIPFILMIVEFISIVIFYNNILEEIIEKSLSNFETFNVFLEENIIFINKV